MSPSRISWKTPIPRYIEVDRDLGGNTVRVPLYSEFMRAAKQVVILQKALSSKGKDELEEIKSRVVKTFFGYAVMEATSNFLKAIVKAIISDSSDKMGTEMWGFGSIVNSNAMQAVGFPAARNAALRAGLPANNFNNTQLLNAALAESQESGLLGAIFESDLYKQQRFTVKRSSPNPDQVDFFDMTIMYNGKRISIGGMEYKARWAETKAKRLLSVGSITIYTKTLAPLAPQITDDLVRKVAAYKIMNKMQNFLYTRIGKSNLYQGPEYEINIQMLFLFIGLKIKEVLADLAESSSGHSFFRIESDNQWKASSNGELQCSIDLSLDDRELSFFLSGLENRLREYPPYLQFNRFYSVQIDILQAIRNDPVFEEQFFQSLEKRLGKRT